MPKLTEKEIVSLVETEFSRAMGAPGGQISSERAQALSYYLSEPLGNEVEGQSKVVTSDVADVVDGIMPSLLRIFTTQENLVSFDPVGPEDIAAAQQESDYVNYVFFKQNPAFMLLYTWFFDALVQKNGITKCWWDETEVVTTESYSNLTTEQLIQLLMDEELEPVGQSVEVIDGVSLYTIECKRTTKAGRIVVDNIPPEEYRISSDARSLDPAKARMVGQERKIKRSELLAMGFDKKIIEALPRTGANSGSSEEAERYKNTDEQPTESPDKAQDEILVREAYVTADFDGNGKAELKQVWTANNTFLEAAPVDRQPFHIISPKPLPHKHFGRAKAEDVMDIQEVDTTLLRQTLDNLYHTNNPGHAVFEQGIGDTTLDDLMTRRVGSIVRFNRPPGEAYMPLTVPFTAGASFPMMAWFDKVKRDRTGISSDGEGLSPEQLKHVQQSVMAASNDISRMKVEAVARIFAETGLKSLFQHIHELCLKHQDRAKMVKLRNQWVEVNPTEWRTRYDMTVNIGLGVGSREMNQLHLTAIKDMQAAIIQGGGMNLIVSPKQVYNTAAEYVKNANFKDPSLFFTDPGDAQAPPPSSEQEALQAQQQQLIQRQQELDAKDQELKLLKIQLDNQQAMAELKEKSEKREDELLIAMEGLKSDLIEMKLKYGGESARG